MLPCYGAEFSHYIEIPARHVPLTAERHTHTLESTIRTQRGKMGMKLVSVVLSGGAGTRLWPASRQAYPKPFMKLGGQALLAQAVARGQACGTDELLLITNHDHLFLTRNLLEQFADPPN